MSLSYALVSGTTWVNGMSASATNLNAAVNSASISFSNGLTLVGNPSSGAGTMADVPFSTFLQAASNLSDLASVPTARTNLGLGSAALLASSAVLQSANNLSDVGSAGTARTNLGVLAISNNLSDLGSASTARTNLGLGSAATTNSSIYFQITNNFSDSVNTPLCRTNIGLGSGNSPTFASLTAPLNGVSTNSSAASGIVGEFVFVNNVLSPVSFSSSGSRINVTSISLTAGDWDVGGTIEFATDASATATFFTAQSTNTSAGIIISNSGDTTPIYWLGSLPSNQVYSLTLSTCRWSLSTTTTIYLVANGFYSGGSLSAGGVLRARRVR